MTARWRQMNFEQWCDEVERLLGASVGHRERLRGAFFAGMAPAQLVTAAQLDTGYHFRRYLDDMNKDREARLDRALDGPAPKRRPGVTIEVWFGRL